MRTKQEIIDYFQEYIFGFIFRDIENCIKSGANYTVALALLSYTEFLGGLIKGTLGLPNPGMSQERFNAALEFFDWEGDEDYYKNFKIRFRDIDFQEKQGNIYQIFRNGLAHEYFIKGDSYVHNNPDGSVDPNDKGVEVGVFHGKKRLRFHCNAYFRDFKKACLKYYKKLIVEEDKNLLTNFNNALDRISVRKIKF
ncbi:MAG: hypothetical protein ACTSYY_09910 [Promethearchaeota archaeon]